MRSRHWLTHLVFIASFALLSIFVRPQSTEACGGFFCSAVPVVQNAEQIIFRQDGNQIAAIVRIQYSGPAEDFSWVVPVPGIPEVATSSEMLFTNLEQRTRPSFFLETEGESCEPIFLADDSFNGAPQAAPDEAGGVTVLQEKPVGPFNLQVVTSDDPDAMATWLVQNNYDLNDRGRELLAPYIEAGMNFVALRLQKDKDTGDLVPLRMVYQSERPMVPIRLTAVAADPDMGLLVYLVGPAQAIPTNYPYVDVNYARLNWFQWFNGYQQYRSLVTAAMDEVGGLGFATDYAGPANDVVAALPEVSALEMAIEDAAAEPRPEVGLARLFFSNLPQSDLLNLFDNALPLPEGVSQFVYGDADSLANLFNVIQLSQARNEIIPAIRAEILMPYAEGLRALGDNAYLTRLYTTLSPEEMTVDPIFGYNETLPPQPAQRRAIFQQNCVLGTLQWQIVLGEGTKRDGEVISSGVGEPDRFGPLPQAQLEQPAAAASRMINETIDPMQVATGDTPFAIFTPMETLCGVLGFPMLALMGFLAMGTIGRRRKHV